MSLVMSINANEGLLIAADSMAVSSDPKTGSVIDKWFGARKLFVYKDNIVFGILGGSLYECDIDGEHYKYNVQRILSIFKSENPDLSAFEVPIKLLQFAKEKNLKVSTSSDIKGIIVVYAIDDYGNRMAAEVGITDNNITMHDCDLYTAFGITRVVSAMISSLELDHFKNLGLLQKIDLIKYCIEVTGNLDKFTHSMGVGGQVDVYFIVDPNKICPLYGSGWVQNKDVITIKDDSSDGE